MNWNSNFDTSRKDWHTLEWSDKTYNLWCKILSNIIFILLIYIYARHMWQFVSEWKLIYTDMRFSTISSRRVTGYTFIMILVQAFYDGLMISIPTQLMTVLQSPFMTNRGERRLKKKKSSPDSLDFYWIAFAFATFS